MENNKLAQEIAKLTRKYGLWPTFLRGVVTGLGSVIGATILVGIFVFLLRRVDLIPIVGNYLAEIIGYIVEILEY